MSTFRVETIRLTAIEPIPGADSIELAVVGPQDVGFRSVIAKGSYKAGDLVAYLPEAAILPDWLIEDLGLTGKLGGAKKNRIKPLTLRGQLSQGIVWAPKMSWDAWFRKYYPKIPQAFDTMSKDDRLEDQHFDYAGIDITEKLGIKKYVPEIPSNLGGQMRTAPDWMRATDSENIKRVGDSFVPNEFVYITEKIHGSQCSVAAERDSTTGLLKFYVSSKGVLGRGAVIEESESNAYWRAFTTCQLDKALERLLSITAASNVQIIGEVYGSVQDLTYGNPTGPLKFRAFDIRLDGVFVSATRFFDLADAVDLPTVPLLYRGPYSVEKVMELTDGLESVSGGSLHMREGVVIKPAQDRKERWGRMSVKSVSKIYLARKGGTELE